MIANVLNMIDLCRNYLGYNSVLNTAYEEQIQGIMLQCDLAQKLLWETSAEQKCDVAIIAEPYQNSYR